MRAGTGKLGIMLAAVAALTFAPAARATSEAHPIQVDHRVQVVMYQPDQVYRYIGHYRFESAIEFGADEQIKTISMGDSTAWMMNPSGNMLFLKPVEQNATTNMTLITNKHTYLFELHAEEATDIDAKDMVFIMRFIYPEEGNMQTVSHYLDSVPDTSVDPGKYNFHYSIAGSDAIAPIRIFDDGQFTYFKFHNKNADVPAFFWVDDYGNESLINYRTRGDYIVVERVARRFTLRNGREVVCVYNDAMGPPKTK